MAVRPEVWAGRSASPGEGGEVCGGQGGAPRYAEYIIYEQDQASPSGSGLAHLELLVQGSSLELGFLASPEDGRWSWENQAC